MCHSRWDATLLRGLTALMLITGAWVLTSCKDDNGLTEGDPNYFTSSRGQFTATLSDGTTLFLLPGTAPGTATQTFDITKYYYWTCNIRTAGLNWCYVLNATTLADRYKPTRCDYSEYYRFLLAF